MRICFYTDIAIAAMTGGIGRVTDVLTNHFKQQFGWEVFSIYAFEPKADCQRTQVDGSIQLRLHDRLGLRRLSKNYTQAANYIRENNIQVVIIQTSMDVVSRLRKALDKQNLQRVKTLSVLHYTPGTDEFPIDITQLRNNLRQGKFVVKDLAKGIIAPLYNAIEHYATVRAYQKAYLHGDAVVLLSESYLEMYRKFANLKECSRLIAIPNCVPFATVITESELQQKQPTVLTVGRMTDFPKRISSILKIWQLIERNPLSDGWDLKIVGEGPDLPRFKKNAADLGLKRCSFVGRQNPLDYYRKASIFMMTSIFEGFPMTLVEAQQMGCIPVAYDSFASLKEVITDGISGRVIPNDEDKTYAEVMLKLMRDGTLREKMSREAISNCKKYSQESICLRWKDLINRLTSE